MLDLLITAALRTLLLSLIVELGLRALRIRQPQLHLAAWTAVLLASLAMPMLQRHIPVAVQLPVNLPLSFSGNGNVVHVGNPVQSSDVTSARKFARPAFSPEAAALATAVRAAAAAKAASAAKAGTDWRVWLAVTYLTIAGLMLLRLMVGLALSWRLVRRSRMVRESWTADRPIRESSGVASPVTVGRAILLPADCADWTDDIRKAVIAHEMSHIESGDFYILVLAQLNRAIFWFSPASWWVHGRLARFAELASDDAAIDALGDAPSYASILLDMARRSHSATAGIAMARPATVRERIERILTQGKTPERATAMKRATFALGVAPLAVAAAISIADAAPPNLAALEEQRGPHTIVAIDPKLLDAYAGVYKNQKNGSIMQVTRNGDHLMSGRPPRQAGAEYPYTDHDFFLTSAAMQNSFITDASGAVVRVVHHQAGGTETLERLSTDDGQREIAAINQRVADENMPRTETSIDPKLLDNYVGAYQLNPRMVFTVTRDGDKLFARLTGQKTFDLHPYTDRDFFYTIVAAQLSFVQGTDGRASAVILHQNGRDQTAERVDPAAAQALDRNLDEERKPHTAIAIDPQLIGRYVGRYLNDGLEITVTRESDQLFVQVTGYARYAVYPYSDHDFFATIIPAQISFWTDGDGNAMQLIRHEHGVDAVLNRVD